LNDCREIREVIPWYATRSLPLEQAREVAAHLARCDACQNELVTILRLSVELSESYRSLPGLPGEVRRRVEARTHGKNLASLDVGSFLLGFSLGASTRRGVVPIQGDLRLLGRRIRLFSTGKGGRT